MKLTKSLKVSLALVALATTGVALKAEKMADVPVKVGGMEMLATKNIIENAVNSADHTTLVAAVKAAGLVEALSGEGPFTVFAPTNAAFAALPEGTVETLLKPENKEQLSGILTYHVVAGKFDASAAKQAIMSNEGKATLTTLNGETLTLMMNGPMNVVVVDSKGNVAGISTYDVHQLNGVIHEIDTVLMP